MGIVGDNGRAAIGHYTAAEVARLAGVSPKRIGSWARYGIIPSVSRKPRIYAYADAGEAVLAHYLIEQKLKPKDIRGIVERLRERFGDWPLATAPLEHEGRLVVIREGDDLLIDAVDHPEHQVAAGTFLNLKQVRQALEHGGWVAIKSPREHIEVDPERISGQPVVRGHRVSTETVAELAKRPEGMVVLRDDFALTEQEIREAVGYEEDVEKALAAA
jgi:uncharacterized protein (DUF433 family)/DNA-binding transcriptional MerR regulator